MAPPSKVATELDFEKTQVPSTRSMEQDKQLCLQIVETKAALPSSNNATSDPNKNGYIPKLQFVFGQDKAARKLARSHLVRESRRKKGLKDSSSLRQPNGDIGKAGTANGRSAEQQSTELKRSNAKTAVEYGQDQSKFEESKPVRLCSALLGPGNRDHFATFPVEQYANSDLLTGDYLSMLGYQMFGASVRSEFNPFRDIIFALAMEDPPSFEVIVALAAAHNDALHQREIGAETALHKMKAIRLINDRLGRDGGVVEDGTIFSISALWCILTLPGVMTFGASKMLESSDENRLDPCRAELNQFLEEVHRLSLTPSSPYDDESFAFQSGLPLERLLSGSGLPRDGQYRLTLSRDLQAICRLAILLYIHSIFLDYHALPQIIRGQMKRVRAKIVEHELDRHLNIESIELLLWILFKDEKTTSIDNAARAWRVARMMSFAKSASRPWLVGAGELLFSYLQGRQNSWEDVKMLQVDRPGDRLWGFRLKKVQHDSRR